MTTFKPVYMTVIAFFALLTICFQGCGKQTPLIRNVASRDQAAAVAVLEVSRRGWLEVNVDDVTFKNGIWTVRVSRPRYIPGGHALLEVRTNGIISQVFWGR